MHADLVKLLDLQAKDEALSEVEARLGSTSREVGALDSAVERARLGLEAARRALAEGERRRDELETKIESYRVLQDRRTQRLEQVRNPKEAPVLMAELDLARAALAKEENEWVRSADAVTQLELKVKDEERNIESLEAAQAPERARIAETRARLEVERETVFREREATAGRIEKPLRMRYDRLRKARSSAVVVPLVGGACGGCFTAVPVSYTHLTLPTSDLV